MKLRAAIAIVLSISTGTVLRSVERPSEEPHPSTSINRLRVAESYGKLPLAFEENLGQAAGDVRFVSRGPGYTLWLTPTEAVLGVRKSGDRTSLPLRMKLVGANRSPRVVGRDVAPGESHYISGTDSRRWRTHVPHYTKVEYENVYPGVNLIYYGNQQQLEFDFVVSPRASPELIALTFDGAQRLWIDDDGAVVLDTAAGEMRLRRPVIYQEVDGTRNEIRGGYVLTGDRAIAFQVGSYDPERPLVVDPLLVYSTYLGGSVQDIASGIAVDQEGAAYVVGHTQSLDFPTTPSVQPACSKYTDETGVYCYDVFVTKLSPDGSSIVYSTYFGGTYDDYGYGIAVDWAGSAYITGSTRSQDFPILNALQPTNRSDAAYASEAFVAKLTPDGAALMYSTYLGGGQDDVGNAIAIDSEGSAYVTGWTSSQNFPVATPIQSGLNGPTDAYIAKLSPDGSSLAYSTFIGNQSTDTGNAIAVDWQGNASITGLTVINDGSSTGYILVLKLDASGSRLEYARTLGRGVGNGIAINGDHTYVTGLTAAGLEPVAALQAAPAGGETDAFVAKLDSGGRIEYATYLGGSGVDVGSSIAADFQGNCIVVGVTWSTDFPTVNALQSLGGESDIFIVKIDPQGTNLLFSTYLGGSGSEQDLNAPDAGERQGPALAVSNPFESGSSIYVAGFTGSPDFPTAAPLQAQKTGYVTAFVARIFDDPNDRADLAVTAEAPVEADLGAGLLYRFRVTNHGPADAPEATLTGQLPAGASFEGATYYNQYTGSGSCIREGEALTCHLGTVPAQGSAVVEVAITPIEPGMLVTSAAVTSGKPDGQPDNNTAQASIIVRDLAVTDIGGAPAEAQVGDDIGYLLVVANNGPADATNVRLSDQVPAGVLVKEALIAGSLIPPRPCSHDNQLVECQVDVLPAGTTFAVSIIVTAATPGMLVNTATVQSNEREGNLANNTIETRTTVTRPIADLALALAASPNPVQLGGTVTYTFDVTNVGPSTAAEVMLTATLSGQETFASASVPNGSCTGTFEIACNLGALSSGERVRVTIQTITIRIPDMARTFENVAVVTSAAVDQNPANNTVTVVMNVNTPPVANAGPDQVAAAGPNCQAEVTLDGTASSDPERDVLTYTWTTENLLPPPPIVLSGGGSGGVVTGPMPTGFLPLGIHTIVLTVSDGNGGTATDTVTVTVRDVTNPVLSNVPTPVVVEQTSPAGAAVALGVTTATDNCSGSVPVSSDAPPVFPPGATTIMFTAADAAGNTATATTTVTVVDSIAPAVQILSPEARDYGHADVLAIGFSVWDAGSGLAEGSPEAWLDGTPVSNGQSISLLTLALGEHVVMVSAADVAGNPAFRPVIFRVVATIDTLIAAVNLFAEQRQIDDPGLVRSLLGKLEDAKQALARGNKAVAVNKLNDLIAQVTAQTGQHITPLAGEVLVTDARHVIATLQ